MSKQELARWENKFKLYMVLHPGFKFSGWCGPEEKKCKYYGSGECAKTAHTGRIYVNEKTLKVYMAPKSDQAWRRWDLSRVLCPAWCAEWIRHV